MQYISSIRFILLVFLLQFFSSFLAAQGDYNLPSNFQDADCIFETESFEMSIAERYKSTQNSVSTYYPATVGDLDGDDFGEIVIPGGVHNSNNIIFVFNYKAELKFSITLPNAVSMHTDYDSVILADLDNDGKGEIIVTASNGQRLLIYDNEGTLLVNEPFPTKFPKTVGVADFNNDGIPEIYVGNRIYKYDGIAKSLILLAKATNITDDNTLEATMAQDVDKDGIPELISANTTYKVVLNNPLGDVDNSVTILATCSAINNVTATSYYSTRTFALADIDLDGQIDVVSLVPIFGSTSKIEITVWNPLTGIVKYTERVAEFTGGSFMRNSWPFIGDTDGNGYPDIIFMGGINKQYHTLVYRVEYDKSLNDLVVRTSNDQFDDYSSMCTSMSMFDFNNDGIQEIIYRDESSLRILDGKTLESYPNLEIENCYSGTGWEYPVIASLTPSGESSIIICNGSARGAVNGTLQIYGADRTEGGKPWMPARKVWNQFSFYQNTINDDLKVLANPAPLNVELTTDSGSKTIQPFNGHMFQVGIIRKSSLESIYPLADVTIDAIDFGYNQVDNKLIVDIDIRNGGDASMDPKIPINVYKINNGISQLIYTLELDEELDMGESKDIQLIVNNFEQHLPFDELLIKVADGKDDCNTENNQYTILPTDINGVFYVKKGEIGNGSSWKKAMGELADALQVAQIKNAKYPYSVTQLWVAEGSYFGNFEMQEGVSIYGGFSGVETEISELRALEHPTILDAQNSGRPLTQLTDYTVSTEWRGLTLQNGGTSGDGGGALLRKGSMLSYSIVKNNVTTGGQGGGVYADNSQLINCIVEHNSSSREGGGVYATNTIVRNNTIVKNSIQTPSLEGGGLYSSQSTVCNNIIYKNKREVLGGQAEPNNIYSLGGINHYNLANNDDSVDPLFQKFEDGDYRLLPISSALNVGSNSCVSGRIQDILGNERIYQNKIVDLGAFEYQAAKLTLNKEGYFYVNKTKDGDGANWTNAVKELSDAVTGAKYLNENTPNTVTKIWVAAGTYHGNFEMVEGANVHGGFAGNEIDFNQIDTVANKTYIDAQGLGRALVQNTDFAVPTEWAGLILQNGLASAIDNDVYGGGAYLKKNGILKYSTIRNSRAVATSIHNKVNAYGGGVYLEEGASLQNSILDSNIAEVDNQSPQTIAHGVAHGGGVNSVKNRLAYLIVRNNKTISGGNTDGGAIYSSGDVVNNIVNNNKGKSAVYLANDRIAVNNTIVGNEGEYTVSGTMNSKVQNSIIYNNTVSANNFHQTQFSGYNNLVDVDPNFESNSFKLQTTSPARVIGNASFFPSDLKVDFDNKSRLITLTEDLKIIDAGAYQTDIKIVSAVGDDMEVPFNTDFGAIDLQTKITVTLEFDYELEMDVTWLEGIYNQLEPARYPIVGNLSNFPIGVINSDNVQGTLVVTVNKNHIADIEELEINDSEWLEHIDEGFVIDCESDEVFVKISLPHFATIQFDPNVEFEKIDNEVTVKLNITKPGNHSLKITTVSQDGSNTKIYPLTFIKHFPFWDIIEQRWNNTLVINNNDDNNGGYNFVSYKWYKDGTEIGARQYYSAGDKRTDLLDESSFYHAEMKDVNGVEYTTCKEKPVLMHSGIKVYPNPVRIGGEISVEVSLADGQTGDVAIYSLSGLAMEKISLSNGLTTVVAPSTPGLYIVKVSIKGGVSESMRLVVR